MFIHCGKLSTQGTPTNSLSNSDLGGATLCPQSVRVGLFCGQSPIWGAPLASGRGRQSVALTTAYPLPPTHTASPLYKGAPSGGSRKSVSPSKLQNALPHFPKHPFEWGSV